MTLTTFYLICLILGGTIFILQTLLTLFGAVGGHDIALHHDVSHDAHAPGHDHHSSDSVSWIHGIFTVRAIIAGVAFFGILGLFTQSCKLPMPLTLAIALAGALVAMTITALVLFFFTTLSADGNVYLHDAVGKIGTVYLTIPGGRAGVGKIQVNVKNRTMEYPAVTTHAETLPTGRQVLVVEIDADSTLLVTTPPSTITVENI